MDKNFNFNHRVILVKEHQDSGSCGEIDNKFEVIAEVWANISPINAKQNFSRMKEDKEITHIITIRYREDARKCERILFRDRCFDVVGAICPKENYKVLLFNVNELV